MNDESANTEMERGGPIVAFINLMDKVCFLGAIISALCLAALVVLIIGEIGVAFLSKLIPSMPASIPIAWEYTGYLLGTVFMMGSGLALRTGGHIRLGIILDSLQNDRKRIVETVASVIGLIFTGFMFWSLLQFAMRTFERGTLSPQSFTPLWIPQGLLALGAFLLFMQMFARLLACIVDLPLDNLKMRPKTLED